jgi:uncharacterized membrane protein YqjE
MAESEEPETGLPALVSRLGEDVVSLLDSKLGLLKIEIKEDLSAYGRGLVTMSLGGVVAAVGFALLNVALAFCVAALFSETHLTQPMQHALGFALTGALYLVLGAVIALRTRERLLRHGPTPEKTVQELEKDKAWLRGER